MSDFTDRFAKMADSVKALKDADAESEKTTKEEREAKRAAIGAKFVRDIAPVFDQAKNVLKSKGIDLVIMSQFPPTPRLYYSFHLTRSGGQGKSDIPRTGEFRIGYNGLGLPYADRTEHAQMHRNNAVDIREIIALDPQQDLQPETAARIIEIAIVEWGKLS